jgi:hypothetical protein
MAAVFACESAILPRLCNEAFAATTASIVDAERGSKLNSLKGVPSLDRQAPSQGNDAPVGAFPNDLGPAVERR